jgi:hypothetical protein
MTQPETITGYDLYKQRRWLSISALCSFARCPRLFFYSSGVRLRKPDDTALALHFGSAIHAALGHLTDGQPLPEAIKLFSSVWEDRDSLGDTKRNTARATQMLASFAGHVRNLYRAAPKVELSQELKPRNSSYEVPFAVDIGIRRQLPDGSQDMIPLVGWIDQLVISCQDGNECIAEYKTASEISARFFSSFDRSPQLCAYVAAMRILGKKIPRCFLTALRVSEKNTETLTTPYNITDSDVDNFLQWARFLGNQIVRFEELQMFPKDISACYPYPQFGSQGYQCNYHNLCHLTQDWTQLKSLFTITEESDFILFE